MSLNNCVPHISPQTRPAGGTDKQMTRRIIKKYVTIGKFQKNVVELYLKWTRN